MTTSPEHKHAFLGGSNYHWLNYTEEKLVKVYHNLLAAQKGTELHAFAHEAIRLRIRLPEDGSTLSSYVNDAIQLGMHSEVLLYYSDHAFGTADALLFEDNCLKIYDLKTGTTKTSMLQLYIYAAFWCLARLRSSPEFNPQELVVQLRIYQNNEILEDCPAPSVIIEVMDKIQRFSQILNQIR